MTYGQVGAVCPQCGSAAAVHSVDELAAMARARLGQFGLGYQGPPQGYQQPPGYQAPPPDYQPPPGSGPPPPPSSGFPSPSASSGFPSAPLSSDFPAPPPPPPPPPDYSDSAPPPGYSGQRRPSRWSSGSSTSSSQSSGSSGDSIEDAVAGLAMDAATKFIGRAIGRRVKRAYEERVVPAVAAKQEAMLREQIAIAERHPDLRACLTDNVIFLAGGSRVVPMSSLSRGLTVEQADAIVAQLRNG
jgi:hypothetical protein